MANQFILELKHVSKYLLIFLGVLITLSIAVPIQHELSSPKYGRYYSPDWTSSLRVESTTKDALLVDTLMDIKHDQRYVIDKTIPAGVVF